MLVRTIDDPVGLVARRLLMFDPYFVAGVYESEKTWNPAYDTWSPYNQLRYEYGRRLPLEEPDVAKRYKELWAKM